MKRMKSVEILKAALKKFGPRGEHWIQGSYAEDDYGRQVSDVSGPEAVCWCSVGVLRSVAGPGCRGINKAIGALVVAIEGRKCRRNRGVVTSFNDNPDTTFKDVRRVFRGAIRSLEAA
jgi:hypothetical protein